MKAHAALLITLLSATSLSAASSSSGVFGLVGIGNGQTARFTISQGPQPHLSTSSACAGVIQLRFYDETGNVLAERTARYSPTAVESVEYTPFREAGRAHVRPDVSWLEYPPGPCRGALIGNFEVYANATGQTQFVLPAVQFEFQDMDGKK